MSSIDLEGPAAAKEVVAVASRMGDYLPKVSNSVGNAIADLLPELGADERISALLSASVQENVNAAIHILQHEIASTAAPNAAIEFARNLAQRDVGMAVLLRAYRVGQAQFQQDFITELLRGRDGDHVEGRATLAMVQTISTYVDNVVEQLVETYERARDEWLSHRSAVFVQRVRTLLRKRELDPDVAQHMLGTYDLSQHHLGALLWCDQPRSDGSALSVLNQCARAFAAAAGCAGPPLFVPYDESTAWVWLPLAGNHEVAHSVLENIAVEARIRVGLGEPLPSYSGFRRTHRQADLARTVAQAGNPAPSRLTAFADVAPIATMCSDLDAARFWIAETLGPLAADDERSSVLRETARVFLATGGSFTATAEQMILHRNTAQYRIRKAEELRGRPLREGRLDVELALLACHYLGRAALVSPELVRGHEGGT